jgi:hypothetical protein
MNTQRIRLSAMEIFLLATIALALAVSFIQAWRAERHTQGS